MPNSIKFLPIDDIMGIIEDAFNIVDDDTYDRVEKVVQEDIIDIFNDTASTNTDMTSMNLIKFLIELTYTTIKNIFHIDPEHLYIIRDLILDILVIDNDLNIDIDIQSDSDIDSVDDDYVCEDCLAVKNLTKNDTPIGVYRKYIEEGKPLPECLMKERSVRIFINKELFLSKECVCPVHREEPVKCIPYECTHYVCLEWYDKLEICPICRERTNVSTFSQ